MTETLEIEKKDDLLTAVYYIYNDAEFKNHLYRVLETEGVYRLKKHLL
ncbi:hypothetical protein H4A24_01455 [Staphylococcus schleiferi]|nr:hypothetical protein [Staphylococcus schleiferi]MBF1992160.1 hypothetical protein [Staphylococcus schleiferi]MBF2037610.1 hypothetical protein [Staphylococcus schleiferi]MBF2099446.1 hypothetical protein [Staphylococcus schleiferi]MBF2101870.1 hypothetical protein [Staphylococcus schleiferi]MBF2103902.1 hypothetical protein [Staphylococcus schleiferi]